MKLTSRLLVMVLITAAVVAWVALACEDCDTGARQFLRELARALR